MSNVPAIILKHRVKVLLELALNIMNDQMPHYHADGEECRDCDILGQLRTLLHEYF